MSHQPVRRRARHLGLLKSSARRETKIMRDLFEKGKFDEVNRLAKRLNDAGTLKLTDAGTPIGPGRIAGDFGSEAIGMEGIASPVVGAKSYPEGIAVRKVFNTDSTIVKAKPGPAVNPYADHENPVVRRAGAALAKVRGLLPGKPALKTKTGFRDTYEGRYLPVEDQPGPFGTVPTRYAKKYHKGLLGGSDLPYEINEFVQGEPYFVVGGAMRTTRGKGKNIGDLHRGNVRLVTNPATGGREKVIIDSVVEDLDRPLDFYKPGGKLHDEFQMQHMIPREPVARKLVRDKFHLLRNIDFVDKDGNVLRSGLAYGYRDPASGPSPAKRVRNWVNNARDAVRARVGTQAASRPSSQAPTRRENLPTTRRERLPSGLSDFENVTLPSGLSDFLRQFG